MATRYLSTEGKSGSGASGSTAQRFVFKVDLLATDAITDVIGIAPISGDLIITDINYFTTGVTGLTDMDLGVYKAERNGGDVINADMFDDAINVATSGTDAGMTGVAVGDRYKTVRELAGTSDTEFFLSMTLNTEVTADGTITIIVEATQG